MENNQGTLTAGQVLMLKKGDLIWSTILDFRANGELAVGVTKRKIFAQCDGSCYVCANYDTGRVVHIEAEFASSSGEVCESFKLSDEFYTSEGDAYKQGIQAAERRVRRNKRIMEEDKEEAKASRTRQRILEKSLSDIRKHYKETYD